MNAPLHTPPSNALAARSRLESIINAGTHRAGPVIQRILAEQPTDRVVRSNALAFEVAEDGTVSASLGGAEPLTLHKHAIAQAFDRVGIPTGYGNELRQGKPWQRALLRETLSAHYQNVGERVLVRSVGDSVRGILSNRFRRLDSRPLLEGFVAACNAIGAVPYDGVASDVRSSVRAILPTVIEPVPGEAMVLGLAWNNSDYGAGLFGISMFALRLVCLNGAVGESKIKERHLGRALSEDITFSERTYQLDTKAMVSATTDIVRGALGPAAVESMSNKIRAAHATETSFESAWKKVRGIGKADQESVRQAFEGADVVMLPAGRTEWRMSNALSWVANATDDADRKLDLQRAAGTFAGA